jgi:hypothetical protein
MSAYIAFVQSSLNMKSQAQRKINSEVAVHRLVSLCNHQTDAWECIITLDGAKDSTKICKLLHRHDVVINSPQKTN